ncbi:hypothetical protein [Hyphomonas jannaschiana]|uniref:hypothetical protein n=2 Tax=Hyphomonas TaxID=85 RepID=UPI0035C6C58B
MTMSVLKDLIADFLEEMADFAEPRGRKNRPRKGQPIPVRIRSRDDAEAINRWEGEGGRLPRRKGGFGFPAD